MYHRFLLAVIALAALVVAGCGGSDKPLTVPEYNKVVVLTRDRVDYALARITRAKSEDEFLSRMDEASDTIEDAANDLEDAGVAENYEPENEKLISALHQLSVDVEATAEQIRTPGFEGLLTDSRGISFESWDTVNLALAGLAGKGLHVTILQRH